MDDGLRTAFSTIFVSLLQEYEPLNWTTEEVASLSLLHVIPALFSNTKIFILLSDIVILRFKNQIQHSLEY